MKYVETCILGTGLLTRFGERLIIHPVITNDLVRSTTKAYDFSRDEMYCIITYYVCVMINWSNRCLTPDARLLVSVVD